MYCLDIQFWRSRKTLEGLSVRSIFFNVFQSIVVLLYVIDNDTNTMVIISIFVGLLIEIWKINKVVDIKVWSCCHLHHYDSWKGGRGGVRGELGGQRGEGREGRTMWSFEMKVVIGKSAICTSRMVVNLQFIKNYAEYSLFDVSSSNSKSK